MEKTLDNTTTNQAKDQVSDLKVWGNGDTFKLICKASSKAEGWMKSTKAMEIPGVGCIVQVTTQQMSRTGVTIPTPKLIENGVVKEWVPHYECPEVYYPAVAEALTFVPGVKIDETKDTHGNVTSRKLVAS